MTSNNATAATERALRVADAIHSGEMECLQVTADARQDAQEYVVNPAIRAMRVLQKELQGEAARTGLTTEEAINEIVEHSRRLDRITSTPSSPDRGWTRDELYDT